MKKLRLICTSLILISLQLIHAESITPYFSIRSQGLDAPRHIVGQLQDMYASNAQGIYGSLSAALSYSRSFDDKKITECLFGNSCPTITVSGSRVADRGAKDWLADYFYLPTDFESTLSFKPLVDSVLLDMQFYISLNPWAEGLYLAVYAPVTHSRWALNMCETIAQKGVNNHDAGYFSAASINRTTLLPGFTEYAQGCAIDPLEQTVGTKFITTFDALRNARISCEPLKQTRLADLRIVLGYDAVRNDRYHMGLQFLMAAPTGNRPDGRYLFEPVIGNGHHWELGAGLDCDATLYQSEDDQKKILFYSNAQITHLFAAEQHRTFDLKGRPFSRYMLMERMGATSYNLKGADMASSAQFKQEFQPVANFSRLRIGSSATIQTELTAMFTCVCDAFSWDVGYDFWYRSCDTIRLRGLNPFDTNTKWALKGDAHVYGFDRGAAAAGPLVGAVPLSATQDTATITTGKNFIANRLVADAIKNPGIDSAKNSTGDGSAGGTGTNDYPLSAASDVSSLTIKTSVQPIFISNVDLDMCERKTRGMSHTIFTHFSYIWRERTQWIPYFGVGGKAEFAARDSSSDASCNANACASCVTCALSQWGIWFKGGMNF